MVSRLWRAGIWVAAVLAGGVGAAGEGALAAVEAKIAPTAVGRPANISVVFTVPDGSHISPDAPLTLKFKGPSTVRFLSDVLHYKDADKPGAAAPSFTNQATPTATGDHAIEVDATYYVCTAELCNRQTKTLHLKLVAKPK
ncbi:MAG: hypothetical protein ACYDCL_22800 [Myxococcales bacterium]